MPQLQVSNKTLKLTNVLIAKMTAEDMQDMAFAEKRRTTSSQRAISPSVLLYSTRAWSRAKTAMKKFVWGPHWAEVISKIAPKIAKYAGSSSIVSAACRSLDVSYYLDFCSIGGFIAYGIDRWIDKGSKRNDGRVFE